MHGLVLVSIRAFETLDQGETFIIWMGLRSCLINMVTSIVPFTSLPGVTAQLTMHNASYTVQKRTYN